MVSRRDRPEWTLDAVPDDSAVVFGDERDDEVSILGGANGAERAPERLAAKRLALAGDRRDVPVTNDERLGRVQHVATNPVRDPPHRCVGERLPAVEDRANGERPVDHVRGWSPRSGQALAAGRP